MNTLNATKQTSQLWHFIWKEIAQIMRSTRSKYHYAIRYVQKNEEMLRKNAMAKSISENNYRYLCKEVYKVRSKCKTSSQCMDDVSSNESISELFAHKYNVLYNSVRSNTAQLNELLALNENNIITNCSNNNTSLINRHTHHVSVDHVSEINMYNLETQSLNFMGSHVEYLKVRSWALFYLILLLMILIQLQKKIDLIMYADDTTLISTLETFGNTNRSTKIENNISDEISKITTWLHSNKLKLNASKSKFMIFFKHPKIIPKLIIWANGNQIDEVQEFNFLGITIDQNITWTPHIRKISIKISRVIGVLRKLKHIFPQHILRLIYNSLIHPHLIYGLNLWGFKHNTILYIYYYYITEKSHKNTCISSLHLTFYIRLQGIKNTHVERPLYNPII